MAVIVWRIVHALVKRGYAEIKKWEKQHVITVFIIDSVEVKKLTVRFVEHELFLKEDLKKPGVAANYEFKNLESVIDEILGTISRTGIGSKKNKRLNNSVLGSILRTDKFGTIVFQVNPPSHTDLKKKQG